MNPKERGHFAGLEAEQPGPTRKPFRKADLLRFSPPTLTETRVLMDPLPFFVPKLGLSAVKALQSPFYGPESHSRDSRETLWFGRCKSALRPDHGYLRANSEPGQGRRQEAEERRQVMAVYKPKRKGEASKFYICGFVYQGKRFQESTGATSKTVAKEYEKNRKKELERAAAGLPTVQRANRIRTVSDVITPYLAGYKLNHRAKSMLFAEGRLRHVKQELGNVVLSDLTEDRIRDYIRKRQGKKASGRTINMELGELSRAIGRQWSILWPKVRRLEERKDIGRSLSAAEQKTLVEALKDQHTPHRPALIPILLLTGMRVGEALSLSWSQMDLIGRAIIVGRAKTASGTGRTIPINDDLAAILAIQRTWFLERFGEPKPFHYVFPWGKPVPSDPARHATDITWSWDQLRRATGLSGPLHDLRHTFATRLAENGVSESTMLALMGHMSRAMLERYSHIRMAAKRYALSGLKLHPPANEAENSSAAPVNVPVAAPQATVQ